MNENTGFTAEFEMNLGKDGQIGLSYDFALSPGGLTLTVASSGERIHIPGIELDEIALFLINARRLLQMANDSEPDPDDEDEEDDCDEI